MGQEVAADLAAAIGQAGVQQQPGRLDAAGAQEQRRATLAAVDAALRAGEQEAEAAVRPISLSCCCSVNHRRPGVLGISPSRARG